MSGIKVKDTDNLRALQHHIVGRKITVADDLSRLLGW